MYCDSTTQIHFSPSGTTAQVLAHFTQALTGQAKTIDLLNNPPTEETSFGPEDFVVVGLPVFAGRIPSVCPAMLAKLKGQNTPAVAIVVYGNRDYDDALVELCDLLQAKGFLVLGAAAFIARHSIFPVVATARPDGEDQQKITQFARQCQEKLAKGKEAFVLQETVKGNRPYKETTALPLIPTGDAACTKCQTCVAICPTKAIAEDDPIQTDPARCISCTACIYICPAQARQFRGEMYQTTSKAFAIKCSTRREPEIFL